MRETRRSGPLVKCAALERKIQFYGRLSNHRVEVTRGWMRSHSTANLADPGSSSNVERSVVCLAGDFEPSWATMHPTMHPTMHHAPQGTRSSGLGTKSAVTRASHGGWFDENVVMPHRNMVTPHGGSVLFRHADGRKIPAHSTVGLVGRALDNSRSFVLGGESIPERLVHGPDTGQDCRVSKTRLPSIGLGKEAWQRDWIERSLLRLAAAPESTPWVAVLE